MSGHKKTGINNEAFDQEYCSKNNKNYNNGKENLKNGDNAKQSTERKYDDDSSPSITNENNEPVTIGTSGFAKNDGFKINMKSINKQKPDINDNGTIDFKNVFIENRIDDDKVVNIDRNAKNSHTMNVDYDFGEVKRFSGIFLSLRMKPQEKVLFRRSLREYDVKQENKFTCRLYDGQTEHINVSEVRIDLFASKNKPVTSPPPTSAALYKHALRAAYQAGHILGNALKPEVSTPCPSSWGWTKEKESWTPEWSAVTAIWSQLSLLDHCGCKSGCETMRCGYRRVSLPCTAQCKSCKGGCTNQNSTSTGEPEEN